jgi:hypothetical protein
MKESAENTWIQEKESSRRMSKKKSITKRIIISFLS